LAKADEAADFKESVDKASNVLDKLKGALGRASEEFRKRFIQKGVEALDHVSEKLNKVEEEADRYHKLAVDKANVLDGHVVEKSKKLREILDILEAKYWELRDASKYWSGILVEKKQQLLERMRQAINKVRGQLEEHAQRTKRDLSELKRLHDMYKWARRFGFDERFKPVRDFLGKVGEHLSKSNSTQGDDTDHPIVKNARSFWEGLQKGWRDGRDKKQGAREKRELPHVLGELDEKIVDAVKRLNIKDSDVVDFIEELRRNLTIFLLSNLHGDRNKREVEPVVTSESPVTFEEFVAAFDIHGNVRKDLSEEQLERLGRYAQRLHETGEDYKLMELFGGARNKRDAQEVVTAEPPVTYEELLSYLDSHGNVRSDLSQEQLARLARYAQRLYEKGYGL
jgi:uncharacterized coiled-coil DUF342 family protein